jgi:hypothetical protein
MGRADSKFAVSGLAMPNVAHLYISNLQKYKQILRNLKKLHIRGVQRNP